MQTELAVPYVLRAPYTTAFTLVLRPSLARGRSIYHLTLEPRYCSQLLKQSIYYSGERAVSDVQRLIGSLINYAM